MSLASVKIKLPAHVSARFVDMTSSALQSRELNALFVYQEYVYLACLGLFVPLLFANLSYAAAFFLLVSPLCQPVILAYYKINLRHTEIVDFILMMSACAFLLGNTACLFHILNSYDIRHDCNNLQLFNDLLKFQDHYNHVDNNNNNNNKNMNDVMPHLLFRSNISISKKQEDILRLFAHHDRVRDNIYHNETGSNYEPDNDVVVVDSGAGSVVQQLRGPSLSTKFFASISIMIGTAHFMMMLPKCMVAKVMLCTACAVVVVAFALAGVFMDGDTGLACYQATAFPLFFLFWQSLPPYIVNPYKAAAIQQQQHVGGGGGGNPSNSVVDEMHMQQLQQQLHTH